jgi:hypothetical protein
MIIPEPTVSVSMKTHQDRSAAKKKFTPEEDNRLKEVVGTFGCKDWVEVASHMPDRNPRQCRERWTNYANPVIVKKLPWSIHDEALLEQKYAELGPKWQAIAKFFPHRSKNYVRNHWQTKQRHIQKMADRKDATVPKKPTPKEETPAPRQAITSIWDLIPPNADADCAWLPSDDEF